ncbi:MAG: AAA family ATPase [Planctomycetales bacterium]
MTNPPLRSFRAENFEAIRDSGRIEFGWLTAFIGNNGAGKSSLVEALETFRDVVQDGVDRGFQRWRGFEHALNQAPKRTLSKSLAERSRFTHPMQFSSHWRWKGKDLRCQQSITQGEQDTLFIQSEQVVRRQLGLTERWIRNSHGDVYVNGEWQEGNGKKVANPPKLADGSSMLNQFAWESFADWQFLMLNPERMGQPTPQKRAMNVVTLARDGANIAEYLNEIRKLDRSAFEGIVDSLRIVLPYAANLTPSFTSELERAFYLKLEEEDFGIPGWLLSTGTLRIVALLAALRHPKPSPLMVVEEIENGLDPRTLHLLVEEIRAAITAGTTQVILTTHSPYLLDLLDLSQIVVVEREAGEPVFRRPDAEQLADWSKSFSPGRLYTMGRLTPGDHP